LLNKNELIITTIGNILLRNSALFILFLWVEYYYRLILFLYEKDIIHQKEIAFLLEKQDFEKNFSRKKLLPHYFFNTLELVQVETSDKNYDSELFNKVKFLLYYFLVDAELEKVELDKEIAFYKYYIELENLRHKEKTVVNFNILGQPEDFLIIPLLFEPLIGNAMKYTKKDGSGCVDITIDTTNFPVLNFYCKNNYSNGSLNIVSSESGLKILEQRLELCYKDKYALNIDQCDDFYEITLSIEIE
jgi:LytS/YehU family sensor histidine kinase